MFEDEDYLKSMLEGRPWLFRRKVILFDRLKEPMERKKIRLICSPFWVKVGSCPPECECKDLMHAIRFTFGGLLHSEEKGDYCHIRVQLDMQKQLRRGIFIIPNYGEKSWVPFKYENLPMFCYSCGKMGHGLQDYDSVFATIKDLSEDELPYFVTLKV